jgi:hypothetical protein
MNAVQEWLILIQLLVVYTIRTTRIKGRNKSKRPCCIKEPKGARGKREREKPTYSQCDAITNDVRDQKKKRKKKE